MGSTWVERIEYFCTRYGPGRLPGAGRRALGAGYACASAAFLSISVFILITATVSAIMPGEGGVVGFGVLALGAYPLVVPSAFVLGGVVWRVIPSGPIVGAFAGVVVTALVYALSTIGVIVALAWPRSYDMGLSSDELLFASTGGGVLVGIIAFLLTCWLTLPIGAAAGYTYERARAERDQ